MDNTESEYQSTLDYLYSFVDYSLTRSLRYSPEKFDLGRMHELVETLGSPHLGYPVVHVAGTKGKGSTCALIASALEEAGYKVGLYTSPHMVDFTERIQVNREPVSHRELVTLVNNLKPVVDKIERLTTFELTTAAAFLHFTQRKVDIAIIEVGLGGRLDATNVVDPLISVITSLSMDHMNVLGDTLEKIAAEKGGIIKTGKPVFVAHQKPEAMEVLRQISKSRGSRLIQVDKVLRADSIGNSLDGQDFFICKLRSKTHDSGCPKIHLQLLGAHQAQNALTAFAVLDYLRSHGWKLSLEQIAHSFGNTTWPGRFEILQRNPLVIIDSAHNLDSAEKLVQTVTDYLADKELTLVFGASEDKDVSGMLEILGSISAKIVVSQSIHPRSYDANELAVVAGKFHQRVISIRPLETALDHAMETMPSDGVLLVTGSIFLAAGAREYFNKDNLKLA